MTTSVRIGRCPYDYDVAVIGAGPAGLAAAIRVRWLKGFDPYPSSVVVLEPGSLGGLGGWGSCVLTGPGWSLSGSELVERLVSDVTTLAIPVVPLRVERVERQGMYLVVNGGTQRIRVLALVLASGLRTLTNEERHFPEGVTIAMKGRAHLDAIVGRALEAGRRGGLVVIGNARTALLGPLFTAPAGAAPIHWVIEPSATAPEAIPALPPPVVRGRLVAVEGERAVESVLVDTSNGTLRIPCTSVFIDYHAFELEPAVSVEGLAELGVGLSPAGFVEVDAWNATRAAGVYAAGDVTGRYASTLTALGDGVSAGFGAHRHAFLAKFGREPDLFAYRGLDRSLPSRVDDSAPISDDCVAVLVGTRERARAACERALDREVARSLVDRIDCQDVTVAALAEDLGISRGSLDAALRSAIQSREIVIHREPGAAGTTTVPTP